MPVPVSAPEPVPSCLLRLPTSPAAPFPPICTSSAPSFALRKMKFPSRKLPILSWPSPGFAARTALHIALTIRTLRGSIQAGGGFHATRRKVSPAGSAGPVGGRAGGVAWQSARPCPAGRAAEGSAESGSERGPATGQEKRPEQAAVHHLRRSPGGKRGPRGHRPGGQHPHRPEKRKL